MPPSWDGFCKQTATSLRWSEVETTSTFALQDATTSDDIVRSRRSPQTRPSRIPTPKQSHQHSNHTHTSAMSSHVPFLAVRPDEQFSTEVKKTVSNAVKPNAAPPSQPTDSAPPLTPAPPKTYLASRVPPALRFPLLVLLSLGLSTLFRTWTSNYSGLELATASRSLQEPSQIGVLLGWKAVQLFIAWVAGYDCTCGTHTRLSKVY